MHQEASSFGLLFGRRHVRDQAREVDFCRQRQGSLQEDTTASDNQDTRFSEVQSPRMLQQCQERPNVVRRRWARQLRERGGENTGVPRLHPYLVSAIPARILIASLRGSCWRILALVALIAIVLGYLIGALLIRRIHGFERLWIGLVTAAAACHESSNLQSLHDIKG